MTQKNAELQAKIDYYFGSNNIVMLPEGLKGQVVSVDPKFQFVVLNIGEDQGARTHGEMLVSRNGKFIGKVHISNVDKTQSVANILPGWQQGEVMEGDQVISSPD